MVGVDGEHWKERGQKEVGGGGVERWWSCHHDGCADLQPVLTIGRCSNTLGSFPTDDTKLSFGRNMSGFGIFFKLHIYVVFSM